MNFKYVNINCISVKLLQKEAERAHRNQGPSSSARASQHRVHGQRLQRAHRWAAEQRLPCTDVIPRARAICGDTPAKAPLHPSQVSIPSIHRHRCSQGHPHPPQTSFLWPWSQAAPPCSQVRELGHAGLEISGPCAPAMLFPCSDPLRSSRPIPSLA